MDVDGHKLKSFVFTVQMIQDDLKETLRQHDVMRYNTARQLANNALIRCEQILENMAGLDALREM